MLKKIVSILLVFSVNLFLLAHAVLPHHHHHNGVPHFSFSLMEEHHHDHDSCCCSHSEEGDDSCAFDQDVDVVYESKQHCLCGVDHAGHSDAFLYLPTAVLLASLYDTSVFLQDVPLIVPPYLISYCQDPVISSSGLRAPPVIS